MLFRSVEKITKTRAPKRKRVTQEETKVNEELQRAERENETGEAQLMEEAHLMEETNMNAPPPTTPRRSQRLEQQSQSPNTPRRS